MTAAGERLVAPEPGLATSVRRGLAWGGVSSIVLRAGNLLTGIVLARLLSPAAFGVFAVALTVQAVLVTLADLGMSADLVRAPDPAERAPTVATLALAAGSLLTALMAATAVPVSTALGSATAAPVVAVLACTLLLSSAGVVPYALLQRRFDQRKLFAVDAAGFCVSTGVAIVLVVLGVGPMALALSRLAGQALTTVLQFRFAGVRPRFGFDRTVAGGALRFGVPLAAANMLSWALLSIDNVVVSRTTGVVALGFYVLAFNISSWPMTAVGQAVRPVTLAAFSRLDDPQRAASVARATALTAAAAAPVGVLLAVLADPVVSLLYGSRWSAAAAALPGLALFGGLRIVLDMLATYLTARGLVAAVLWTQVCWIVALVPAMVIGIRWGGLAGAGYAHLLVGVVLIVPIYLLALRRSGVPVSTVLGAVWQPVLAAVPAGFAAAVVLSSIRSPLLGLVAGGSAGLAAYLLLLCRWLRTRISGAAAEDVPEDDVPALEER